jgi:hypothetical protein
MKAHTDSPSGTQRPLHIVLYRCAAVIFVFGLAASALTYLFADDETTDLGRQVTSAKMYQHNIQLMGGRTALYATRFNEWFAERWQGRQLAYTIAVIAATIAAGCFLFGLLISTPLPHDPNDSG